MRKFKVYTEAKDTGERAYCRASGQEPEMFTHSEALTVLDSIKMALSVKFLAGVEEMTV